MQKIISTAEVGQQLGAIIEWATEDAEGVIIESGGKPKAVLISFEEYQRIQQLRKITRQQDRLARLEALTRQTG